MTDYPNEPVEPGPDGVSPVVPDPEEANRLEQQRKNDKQWIPFVVAGTIVALIIGGIVFWNTRDDQQPTSPVVTSSAPVETSAPGTGEPEPTEPVTTEETTGEETTTVKETTVEETTDSGQKDQMTIAAENFVTSLKSGASGTKWADSMKTMVSSAFYESLKHADPASIPDGAETVTVSSSGTDKWTASVADAEGNVLYTFVMQGFKTADDGATLLVTSLDIPQSDEPRLDSDGHPIPASITPLTEAATGSFQAQSIGVLKNYFEVRLSDNEKERAEKMSRTVGGGEYPPFRSFEMTPNSVIQIYSPEEGYLLNAAQGHQVQEGFVTLASQVTYADAASDEQAPIETLLMGVDFKWNEDSRTWVPGGLRILDGE